MGKARAVGHHRTAGRREGVRQRGVSRGVVFTVLAVILVAGLVVVWNQLGNRIDDEADRAAATCVEGTTTVPVIADASLVPGLTTIAQAYAETKPVIRDHCITIKVRAGDSKVTLDGLAGSWDSTTMGAFPAAWVPQSSIWAAELTAAKPAAVDGRPESLVTSPVVLAMNPDLAKAFGDDLTWGQLPTLQTRDNSLAGVGRDGWGSLRMAMPLGTGSDATALSSQAIAAAVTRTTGALTESDATSQRVASSVGAVLRDAPATPDGTPASAVETIAASTDPATAAIRAVPVTEQSLYAGTRDDSRVRVTEVVPGGATPIADYPIIKTAGSAVSTAHTDAVADFFAFANRPEQLAALTALGFRGAAAMPKPSAAVTFPVIENPMPNPEQGAIVAINRVVYGPGIAPPPASATTEQTSDSSPAAN